jgi:hypothetical protein
MDATAFSKKWMPLHLWRVVFCKWKLFGMNKRKDFFMEFFLFLSEFCKSDNSHWS